MSGGTLLVFLKAPEPGRVKTRLAAEIGAAAAARAYRRMCASVRDRALSLRERVVWVYAPSAAYPDLAWLGLGGQAFWSQSGTTLGERLRRAFRRAFAGSRGPACVIGTDSPDLPATRLRSAFRALKAADAVLGPTEDGGYYLLGMRRYRPELLRRIPWSTGGVRAATEERARAAGLRLALLPAHYDIDTTAGLRRWRSNR